VLYANDGCTIIEKIPSSDNARIAMSESQKGVVYTVSFITMQALIATFDRTDTNRNF